MINSQIPMTHPQLHPYQNALVKKLALAPPKGIAFNDTLLEGISSDHTNYHLKQLIRFGIVNKVDSHYLLSDKGKEYSGSLDDAMKHLEKQPKVSVIVWVMRKRPDGVNEYLVNKRTKHPYFGKVGRITGKVQYGESLKEAALRELYEETGLRADFIQLDKIYHKVRKRPDNTIVQDNMFFIFFLTDAQGELVPKTEFQENFWVTIDDVVNRRHDFYDDFVIDDRDKPHDTIEYEESIAIADGF